MILIDVEVPILGKIYDMQVDEDTPVSFLVEDMIGMICQKEQLIPSAPPEEAILWDKERRRKIAMNQTLNGCGIQAGQTLILL